MGVIRGARRGGEVGGAAQGAPPRSRAGRLFHRRASRETATHGPGDAGGTWFRIPRRAGRTGIAAGAGVFPAASRVYERGRLFWTGMV